MGDYIFYKAIESYTSNDRRMLSVEKDDVLKLQTPIVKVGSHSKRWLHVYNERTKEHGCVPGNIPLLKPTSVPYF